MTGIATGLGLTPNAVKAWISVLLMSCQIVVLQPYHANPGRRLVKRHAAAGATPRPEMARGIAELGSPWSLAAGAGVVVARGTSEYRPYPQPPRAQGRRSRRRYWERRRRAPLRLEPPCRRDVKFSCVSCCTGNGQAVECHNGPARKGDR